MSRQLRGVVPIIPTAFDAEQRVDFEATAQLVRFAVACGAHAVALPAFGSEFYKLSDDERIGVVKAAVAAANGRVPVVGMANHPGARIAAELAGRMEEVGADLIGLNLPRSFPVGEGDLLRYAAAVGDAIEVPLLVQDWNPGGPTVGPDFCVRLHERCPNFLYIKLEEPRMGPKMRAIHEATEQRVGVLEGWGGLFLLELVPHGCVGSMPGLAVCDVLVRVWDHLQAGEMIEAFELFSEVMAYIYFSLEDFEIYHHLEKRLLVDRGALVAPQVRDLTSYPNTFDGSYFELLADRLWATLDRHGFARCPLDAA